MKMQVTSKGIMPIEVLAACGQFPFLVGLLNAKADWTWTYLPATWCSFRDFSRLFKVSSPQEPMSWFSFVRLGIAAMIISSDWISTWLTGLLFKMYWVEDSEVKKIKDQCLNMKSVLCQNIFIPHKASPEESPSKQF